VQANPSSRNLKSQKTRFGKLSDSEIRKAILQTLGSPDNGDANSIKFAQMNADLNNDGQAELIVWATCCGGTGGYPLLIFQKSGKRLKLISMIDLVWTPVIVLNSRKNGWHSLVMQEHDDQTECR
jgi:hypothetical protein